MLWKNVHFAYKEREKEDIPPVLKYAQQGQENSVI